MRYSVMLSVLRAEWPAADAGLTADPATAGSRYGDGVLPEDRHHAGVRRLARKESSGCGLAPPVLAGPEEGSERHEHANLRSHGG